LRGKKVAGVAKGSGMDVLLRGRDNNPSSVGFSRSRFVRAQLGAAVRRQRALRRGHAASGPKRDALLQAYVVGLRRSG
jgi:hypothetical protein